MFEFKIEKESSKNIKFKEEFSCFRKLIVVTDDTFYKVTNYVEFLRIILFVNTEDVYSIEEIFVNYIKCIASIEDVEIKVVESINENSMVNTEKMKCLSLSNLQSIIACIIELNVECSKNFNSILNKKLRGYMYGLSIF